MAEGPTPSVSWVLTLLEISGPAVTPITETARSTIAARCPIRRNSTATRETIKHHITILYGHRGNIQVTSNTVLRARMNNPQRQIYKYYQHVWTAKIVFTPSSTFENGQFAIFLGRKSVENQSKSGTNLFCTGAETIFGRLPVSRVSQNESRSGYWICSVNCESTHCLLAQTKDLVVGVFMQSKQLLLSLKHTVVLRTDLRVCLALVIWIFFFRASDMPLNWYSPVLSVSVWLLF